MKQIIISKDFSENPGGRFSKEGDFSGEQFRNELLVKAFDEAIKQREKLSINFDGGYGYATSFLEEAFGGLARIYGSKTVLETLQFISEDEPSLIDSVKNYIKKA